ncbi:substrate-binding domain-containing protein [Nonomuraea sp. B19D2]|uniref:substrate-binding domain-containing protein n=1 Tax=Nonomuraea sp. B19D2 TaxID=3159561 RepID=UPI0032DA4E20
MKLALTAACSGSAAVLGEHLDDDLLSHAHPLQFALDLGQLLRLVGQYHTACGEGPRATYVTCDTAAGARQVAIHLLDLGHRRIARIEGAYRATVQLLAERRDFTAIAAESDMIAVGVLRALDEHTLCVPQDLSVTGSDDLQLSAYLRPPLTTVHRAPAALGAQAVSTLLSLIDDTAPPSPTVLPVSLVTRDSTADAR